MTIGLDIEVQQENSIYPNSKKGELFSTAGGIHTGSCDIEHLELLFGLVRCLKPESILETGTLTGLSLEVMMQACTANGSGKIISLEMDREIFLKTYERLKNSYPDSNNYTIVNQNSMDYLAKTNQKFDFCFYDSDVPIRPFEFELCLKRQLLNPGAFVAFHDSGGMLREDNSNHIFWKEINRIVSDYHLVNLVEFPYSRGLLLIQI